MRGVLLLFFFSVFAFADQKEFYYQRYLQSLQKQRLRLPVKSRCDVLSQTKPDQTDTQMQPSQIQEATFDQMLNYDDSTDLRTFKQRFFINSEYADSPESPVLFYICGEFPCSSWYFSGATTEHAKKLKAHIVALEHRYYGKSQPFSTLTTENLQYLKTEFALKDLARFQEHMMNERGFKGKWIAIGGSYPGSLAAYYRLKYPDLVVGALASSAPVHAKENFEEYDLHVATVAGPDCANLMREVVKQAENALKDPQKSIEFKKRFDAQDIQEDVDFLYLIADVGASAIQYGYRDRFCNEMDEEDPVSGYAKFARWLFQKWKTKAVNFSVQSAMNEDTSSSDNESGSRAWYYQSCTEYGYWQNAYHDPAFSVRSSRINAEYHANLCKRLFGIEKPANTTLINTQFYEPLFDPVTSHIFFTNGSQDPWSRLSIFRENNSNPKITTFKISGAAHAEDLSASKDTDSVALTKARSWFLKQAIQWLY